MTMNMGLLGLLDRFRLDRDRGNPSFGGALIQHWEQVLECEGFFPKLIVSSEIELI